jgi:hypothetical protein
MYSSLLIVTIGHQCRYGCSAGQSEASWTKRRHGGPSTLNTRQQCRTPIDQCPESISSRRGKDGVHDTDTGDMLPASSNSTKVRTLHNGLLQRGLRPKSVSTHGWLSQPCIPRAPTQPMAVPQPCPLLQLYLHPQAPQQPQYYPQPHPPPPPELR